MGGLKIEGLLYMYTYDICAIHVDLFSNAVFSVDMPACLGIVGHHMPANLKYGGLSWMRL